MKKFWCFLKVHDWYPIWCDYYLDEKNNRGTLAMFKCTSCGELRFWQLPLGFIPLEDLRVNTSKDNKLLSLGGSLYE